MEGTGEGRRGEWLREGGGERGRVSIGGGRGCEGAGGRRGRWGVGDGVVRGGDKIEVWEETGAIECL